MSKAEVVEKSGESPKPRSLRLWPGVIIVALQLLIRFVVPVLVPNGMIIGVFGGMLGTLLIAVWWIFFSRAHRIERFGAIILIIASLYGTSFLLDKSIATANMGLMFIIYSTPVMCLALVILAVATRNLSIAFRRATMIITILLASGIWIVIRTNGMTGEGQHDLDWRWAKTDEERLLAQAENEKNESASEKRAEGTSPGWSGFNPVMFIVESNIHKRRISGRCPARHEARVDHAYVCCQCFGCTQLFHRTLHYGGLLSHRCRTHLPLISEPG